jgi:hypothetical protein
MGLRRIGSYRYLCNRQLDIDRTRKGLGLMDLSGKSSSEPRHLRHDLQLADIIRKMRKNWRTVGESIPGWTPWQLMIGFVFPCLGMQDEIDNLELGERALLYLVQEN